MHPNQRSVEKQILATPTTEETTRKANKEVANIFKSNKGDDTAHISLHDDNPDAEVSLGEQSRDNAPHSPSLT